MSFNLYFINSVGKYPKPFFYIIWVGFGIRVYCIVINVCCCFPGDKIMSHPLWKLDFQLIAGSIYSC